MKNQSIRIVLDVLESRVNSRLRQIGKLTGLFGTPTDYTYKVSRTEGSPEVYDEEVGILTIQRNILSDLFLNKTKDYGIETMTFLVTKSNITLQIEFNGERTPSEYVYKNLNDVTDVQICHWIDTLGHDMISIYNEQNQDGTSIYNPVTKLFG